MSASNFELTRVPRARCFLVAILALGVCSAKDHSLVPDRELALGGIELGDAESTVVKKLGEPRRITDTDDFLNIELEYPGLTVWLGEGRLVGAILSTSKRYCTPSGVCPGMPFAKVKAKYGPPLVADREDGRFMEYPSSQSPCWLQIAAKKGIVQSVGAECQP